MARRATSDAPKRRLKGPERRALIERAAAELFAERGYDGVSLEEIGEAAGVSRTVIYDHFPSKSALHARLCEDHAGRLLVHMAERAAGEGPPLERMRTGIDAVLEFIENDPYAWRIMFSEMAADPERAELAHRLSGQATDAIAALVRANPAAAPLIAERGDDFVDRFATFMRSGISGIAAWWFEHPDVPREQIRDEIVQLLWLGMQRILAGERDLAE
jgi:AcrR family transcriptional regulator